MNTSCPSMRICLGLLAVAFLLPDWPAAEPPPRVDELAGQVADIASSAYQYRADRKAEENPPESWLALMRYAGQPLNKPVDVNAPAIKQSLCAALGGDPPGAKVGVDLGPDARRRPAPEDLAITTLDQQGAASSWWNNLTARQQAVKPAVSGDWPDLRL